MRQSVLRHHHTVLSEKKLKNLDKSFTKPKILFKSFERPINWNEWIDPYP